MRIGKYEIKHPIIQGGMGVGVSWDQLAGTVSSEGALGVISGVGTGYYKDKEFAKRVAKGKPVTSTEFYNREALFEIIKNARKICGDAPLACNILYACNDYERTFKDACAAGFNMIITGAGLPFNMPKYAENYPDVALIPVISSVRALKLIIRKWKKYDRLPDAVVVEGPLSGGHQGFSYEDCSKDEFQLDNILPPVIEEAKKLGIPVFAAGGVWNKKDIEKYQAMGCTGVQMGTRFVGTVECDAPQAFKDILLGSKKEDIKLLKSPVGLPGRGILTTLQADMKTGTAPKVACVSDCLAPCNHGEKAREVGYCIADALGAAHEGNLDTGLYFSGSNGYRIEKLISVHELIQKLTQGE